MPTHRVYFGDNQNISANAKMPVECHAYMPRWRAIPPSVISRIPMYTLVYQCIPMYTLLYPAYLTIIDLNASKDIAGTHCLCGCGCWFKRAVFSCKCVLCIEHMNIYDGSKKISSVHLWRLVATILILIRIIRPLHIFSNHHQCRQDHDVFEGRRQHRHQRRGAG